jgi:cytochrome c-type biogenesis protein CcmH
VIRLLAVALVLAVGLALAGPGPSLASEERPTLEELENEVNCPTCKTTLALSNAPVANRIRAFINERIAAGDTKSEIKAALVEEFGEGILAAPPKEGFNLLAWLLPLVGLACAAVLVGGLVWRAARSGRGRDVTPGDPSLNGRGRLDPEAERRLDEELARFDG